MTAEDTRSTATLALDEPPTTRFDVDVVFVPFPPGGGDPVFRFFGLTAPNDAQVETAQADFTLTLSINGPGTVSFAADPITWLLPGDQTQAIDRPGYITEPVVNGNQVSFTDFNLADSSAAILVSFVVKVSYQPENGSSRRLASEGIAFFEQTFTSHDPTIINVDPTGNLAPTGA